MKQEEKELLLKDLCARLPYGVKCQIQEDKYTYIETLCRIEIDNKNGNLLDFVETISYFDSQVYLSEVKPCLFPISSMTEEQKFIYSDLCYNVTHSLGCDTQSLNKLVDWLNKNHFDYRGLIEKGLAIDATGLNIY